MYPPAPPPPDQFGAPVGPAPKPVSNAVRLMYLRAALGAVGLIIVLATRSSLKQQIINSNPGADSARIDSLVNAAIAVGIVVAFIFLVLYVLLARQVAKGKRWARITTLILAGLGVLSALASLAQTQTGLNRASSLIDGVIDAAVFVLLLQRPSSDYFRAGPRR